MSKRSLGEHSSGRLPTSKKRGGGGYKLRHLSFLLLLAVASCVGVGFSSWTIGNKTDEATIDPTIGSLETISLSDYVKVTNVSDLEIANIGDSDNPSYIIFEDGKGVYEGDIAITCSLQITDGLINYIAEDSSSFNINIDAVFESDAEGFDISQYISIDDCDVSATYYIITGSSSVGVGGSPDAAFSKTNAKEVSSRITLSPVVNGQQYYFDGVDRVIVSMTYRVAFNDSSTISDNYENIISTTATLEVSLP